MFTGIVEELGTVESFDGSRLRIRATAVLDGDIDEFMVGYLQWRRRESE